MLFKLKFSKFKYKLLLTHRFKFLGQVFQLERLGHLSKNHFWSIFMLLKYAKSIFEYVAKCKNVTKFEVVELSLHEIFTKEVGVVREK